MNFIITTTDHIKVEHLLAPLKNDEAGATGLFAGIVRNVNQEKEVSCLEYETFKLLADKMICKIVEEAKFKFNLISAICVLSVGRLKIGEIVVVLITTSKHKQEAYQAKQFMIDRAKQDEPIRKKECWKDATYNWEHNCNCHLPHKDLEEYLLHHQ